MLMPGVLQENFKNYFKKFNETLGSMGAALTKDVMDEQQKTMNRAMFQMIADWVSNGDIAIPVTGVVGESPFSGIATKKEIKLDVSRALNRYAPNDNPPGSEGNPEDFDLAFAGAVAEMLGNAEVTVNICLPTLVPVGTGKMNLSLLQTLGEVAMATTLKLKKLEMFSKCSKYIFEDGKPTDKINTEYDENYDGNAELAKTVESVVSVMTKIQCPVTGDLAYSSVAGLGCII